MTKVPLVKIKESDLQRTILDWLTLNRVFHFRNNTGATIAEHKGKKRFFRFGAKGSNDIFAVVKGQLVGIECKGTNGVQSPDQKKFEEELTKAGGIYILARSLEDVIAGMP